MVLWAAVARSHCAQRHRWSARRSVRPRTSAPRLMSRTGRWVGIFFPAPGRFSILLIEASADVLAADAGPVVLVASVSSPALSEPASDAVMHSDTSNCCTGGAPLNLRPEVC
jgi:hypothetical protein